MEQQYRETEARMWHQHRLVAPVLPVQSLPAPNAREGDLLQEPLAVLPGWGRTVQRRSGCCLQQVLACHSVLGLQHVEKVLSEAQASVGQRQGCFGLQGHALHGPTV